MEPLVNTNKTFSIFPETKKLHKPTKFSKQKKNILYPPIKASSSISSLS
jgi:hypothetical protein